ncbi:hypothetical protein MVLG_03388 [Microbotryum lychnidis-dioicae p1A1 Lamole]|uniref:Uncharacterized protein n=1 Tax=Microbotryum lychnidis-dioicae (strain p1A1 Lamole / MvSl-1064) TaxID=683840 RepID=U5H821_USTV1|nr:hypothetical protein MVLG_03388 [Microbotryum lychnidis-dioicae p1A1 Lamole]|eukprot:KDE06229.1 hypothetical protein MVLG_03388 [Microbotryum lychnidis-dioicae p1A1 Lamole]
MSFEDSRAAWRLRQRAVPYPTMPTMAVRERAFKSGRALTGRADASSSALRDGAPAAASPPTVKLDRSPGACLGFMSTSNPRLPMLCSSHSGDIVVYLPEADGNEMALMASSTNCTPEERLCAAFAKTYRGINRILVLTPTTPVQRPLHACALAATEHAVMVAAGRTAESNEMYAMCILRYLK